MGKQEGATAPKRLTGRRSMRLLLCVAGAAVLGSTAMGSSLAAAAAHPARATLLGAPTAVVVGTGLVDCESVTGEVGYTVPSIAGGGANETISIWFVGKKCVPAGGAGAAPVPASVIGSMSFTSNLKNGCPLLSPPALGTGVLNLTYNYPPVPATVINPSVAMPVTVTQAGALWNLTLAPGGSVLGSYPSATFSASIKPVTIAGQNCGTGINAEYISRGVLANV